MKVPVVDTRVPSVMKKQHFQHGQMLGGASNNNLIYGSSQNETGEKAKAYNEKHLQYSFHSSSSDVTCKNDCNDMYPSERNSELNMGKNNEDLADKNVGNVFCKLGTNMDLEEDKKDKDNCSKQLTSCKAALGQQNRGEVDNHTFIKRIVGNTSDSAKEFLTFGKPGCGAPLRTNSGAIKTVIQIDREIRFQKRERDQLYDIIQPNSKNTLKYSTENINVLGQRNKSPCALKIKENVLSNSDGKLMKFSPRIRVNSQSMNNRSNGRRKSLAAGYIDTTSNDYLNLGVTQVSRRNRINDADLTRRNSRSDRSKPRTLLYEMQTPYQSDSFNLNRKLGKLKPNSPCISAGHWELDSQLRNQVTEANNVLVDIHTKPPERYFPWNRGGCGAPIRNEEGKIVTQILGQWKSELIPSLPTDGVELSMKQKCEEMIENRSDNSRGVYNHGSNCSNIQYDDEEEFEKKNANEVFKREIYLNEDLKNPIIHRRKQSLDSVLKKAFPENSCSNTPNTSSKISALKNPFLSFQPVSLNLKDNKQTEYFQLGYNRDKEFVASSANQVKQCSSDGEPASSRQIIEDENEALDSIKTDQYLLADSTHVLEMTNQYDALLAEKLVSEQNPLNLTEKNAARKLFLNAEGSLNYKFANQSTSSKFKLSKKESITESPLYAAHLENDRTLADNHVIDLIPAITRSQKMEDNYHRNNLNKGIGLSGNANESKQVNTAVVFSNSLKSKLKSRQNR